MFWIGLITGISITTIIALIFIAWLFKGGVWHG